MLTILHIRGPFELALLIMAVKGDLTFFFVQTKAMRFPLSAVLSILIYLLALTLFRYQRFYQFSVLMFKLKRKKPANFFIKCSLSFILFYFHDKGFHGISPIRTNPRATHMFFFFNFFWVRRAFIYEYIIVFTFKTKIKSPEQKLNLVKRCA